ncbi:MAG: hydroxymethylbilane synthase [Sphingomicrobium sp.]
MVRKIILGTRGSPLALAQARQVASRIEVAHAWPADTVEIKVVRTTGDRVQDRPLAEIGGKALWTKELDAALLAGETDISVHSMKDVESERPDAFCVAAMPRRADVRDRLIGAGSIEALKQGAVIGTSSPRRAAQLLSVRPDLRIVPIRGNVETRLKKLEAGECDATLLAAAGLDRLHHGEIGVALDALLPAPAQGAIGVECRRADSAMRRIVAAISHAATFHAVLAERAFTRALGGSCHSPVAALAIFERDGRIWLRAEILSEDGAERLSDEIRFAAGDHDSPAALARAMLARAPATIARLFEGESASVTT